MRERRKATEAAPNTATKVRREKDLCKVLDYFRYKVGTSLDAARELGILRNSVTWYIDELEKMKVLQVVCRKADRTTHFMAKHYSADSSLWRKDIPQQLDLFGKEAFNG